MKERWSKRRRLEKHDGCSGGGGGIGSLPMDLLLIILLQLPAWSLLRLRCVCKSWLSIISSPQFQKDYINKSSQRLRALVNFGGAFLDHCPISCFFDDVIIHHPPGVVSITNKQWKEPPYRVTVIGSQNGLICLYFFPHFNTPKPYCRRRRKSPQIVIWNPSTRKCKSLPSFDVPEETHLSACCFGFEFDHSTACYKVTGLFICCYINVPSIIKSYTFTSTHHPPSWKIIGRAKMPMFLFSRELSEEAFVNGTFYFNDHYGCKVKSFNVESNQYQNVHIRHPNEYLKTSHTSLAVCERSRRLHLLMNYKECAQVFILEEHPSRAWTKLCTIDYHYHNILPGPKMSTGFKMSMCSLNLLNDGWLMIQNVRMQVYLIYNPKDDCLIFSQLVDVIYPAVTHKVCTYVESLTSI